MSAAWAALLNLSSDGIILIDQAERIVAVSAAATQIFDRPAESIIGMAIHDLLGISMALALGAPGPQVIDRPSLPDDLILRAQALPDGTLLLIQPAAPALGLRREQRLRAITLAITSALDIDQILQNVVRLTMELIGADAGALPLYDAERDCLIPSYVVNLDDPTTSQPIYRGTGVIWELIARGQPLILNSYADHPRAIPSLVAAGVCAVLAVPLRSHTETFGVLNLYHLRAGRTFSTHDQELLEIVGQQASIAIQNARLYQAALKEAGRRQLLYAAGIEIGAALDPETLYAAIHRAIGRLMPCDTCVIGLYHEERQECEYVYCVDSRGRWPNTAVPTSRGMLGYVIENRLSLRITQSDQGTEAIFNAEPFGEGEDQSQSILVTVLSVGDKVVGALSAQSNAPNTYSSRDLSYLEMLATTAAIAIQNARLFRQVQQLATIDALTGVPNRRSFFTLATRELDRAARYLKPLSVIMLDVDHFKLVNDTHGHLIGDQVLQGVARRCRESLRDVDVLARYGGEEFVILLPETGHTQALQVAHRLQLAMIATPIPTDAGPVSVSLSLGVSSYNRQHTTRLDQLLDQADRAMYHAKRSGRNRVHG